MLDPMFAISDGTQQGIVAAVFFGVVATVITVCITIVALADIKKKK